MPDGTCAVRLRRRLDAEPAEVWHALTDPRALARWLAPPAELQTAVRTEERERILELDWELPGEAPSVVRFELTPLEPGTLLVVEHTAIEEPLGMAYVGRWQRAVDRLAPSP